MVEAVRAKDIIDRLERLERQSWYTQKLLDELGSGTAGQLLNPDDPSLFRFKWNTGGLVYGGISVTENVTPTAIGVAGTPVQLTIFANNQPSNGLTPDHTNDHVTIDIAGDYLIIVSATIESLGAMASLMEMEVMKNSGIAAVGELHVDRNLTGGGGETGSVSMSGFGTLALNDTIEVWIENESNTGNYLVEDITLNLILVGG